MRRFLPEHLKERIRDLRHALGRRAYSQEGEDLILARYFETRSQGFFVDVGAHHPHRFSNTYLFYRRGWRGVNIDAMPGSMDKFRRSRPRDINIEVAIGTQRGSATYFMFNEPALNTFDPTLVAERSMAPWRLVAEVALPVKPLSDVLSEAVPPNQSIDFLSVDVEGRDLDVLQSNDWSRFRPQIVLAETRDRRMMDLDTDPVMQFLASHGYALAAKTLNTSFMIDRTA